MSANGTRPGEWVLRADFTICGDGVGIEFWSHPDLTRGEAARFLAIASARLAQLAADEEPDP